MRSLTILLAVLVAVSVGLLAQSEAVEFGAVPTGTSARATYVFRNSGSLACSIESIGFGEASSVVSGPFRIELPLLPASVPSGGSVQWQITFRPTSTGSFSETMRIRVRCGFFGQTLAVPVAGRTSGVVSETPITSIVTPPSDVVEPTSTVERPTVIRTTEGCSCTAEISDLESDLAALGLYLRAQIGPSIEALSRQVAELESCCEDVAPTSGGAVPLGPFSSEGGARFERFIESYRRLTLQSADDLPRIDPEEEGLQSVLDRGAEVLRTVAGELDQLSSIVAELPPDARSGLDTYVPPAGVEFLDSLYEVNSDPMLHPKLRSLLGSTGQSTGETLLSKAQSWLALIPGIGGIVNALIDDIRELAGGAEDVLAIAGFLFQQELEWKLDGVIRGLFGVHIPANATETELQEALRRITSEPLTDRLDRLAGGLAETDRGLEELSDRVREIERIAGENQSELADLETKICCLVVAMKDYTEQMGLALYGERDAFDFIVPDLCRNVSIGDCTHSTAPIEPDDGFDAIKPEIRSLESDMAWVKETLEEILRLLGGAPQPTVPTPYNPPDTPPDTPPTISVPSEATQIGWLAITKKIYVYAEDTFRATSASWVHEVIVETPAFDVSGWVDLWELRVGDILDIELRIEIDGMDRHFMTTTFEGGPDTRLVYFDELSGGRTFIVGDRIRILFRQTASADDYRTPIPIGYQFIVQSQR